MKAVITGDVINSRKSKAKDWMDSLKSVLNDFGKSPTAWEIYRGDSFQLLLEKPERSLLAAMRIKACLKTRKGRDARMGIGIGTINYLAHAVTESNGDAFVRSGEIFEQLRRKKVTLAISSPWREFDDEMNLNLQLALIAMDSWSEASAEFMNVQLTNKDKSQEELANLLKIGQSSVSERKTRAHYDELLRLEHRFRYRIKELI